MKASIFRWYDLWVGAYWSREDRTLYICPLPTLGVKLDFSPIARHSALRQRLGVDSEGMPK